MLANRQKAIRAVSSPRETADSASSEDPGMCARLVHGNREISVSPPLAEWRAAWRRQMCLRPRCTGRRSQTCPYYL